MKIILVTLLVTCVGAGFFESSETRNERSTNDDSFEENLMKGYNILKNEPNEADTMRFLKELHNMEGEIRDGLGESPDPDAETVKAMEDYAKMKRAHIEPMGDTIEEINHNSGVDTALFQGDMILTKEQADELMEDIKENEGNRN